VKCYPRTTTPSPSTTLQCSILISVKISNDSFVKRIYTNNDQIEECQLKPPISIIIVILKHVHPGLQIYELVLYNLNSGVPLCYTLGLAHGAVCNFMQVGSLLGTC